MLEKRKMLSTNINLSIFYTLYIILLVFTFYISTFGLAFRPKFIPSLEYFV